MSASAWVLWNTHAGYLSYTAYAESPEQAWSKLQWALSNRRALVHPLSEFHAVEMLENWRGYKHQNEEFRRSNKERT